MQSPRLDTLPVELFRNIARLLPLDARNQSLYALSLTSRRMRDLAQPVLFETVILYSGRATQAFSDLLRTEAGTHLATYVLHLSPWVDSGDFDNGQDGRSCAAGIIARCPNLMKTQTRLSVLRLLEYPDRGLGEVFVWLEQLFIPAGVFAHTTRLHIADMQVLLSRRQGLREELSRRPGAFRALYAGALQPCSTLFTAESLPRLEHFSSTWLTYQMEEEDHASVRELVRAVLALPCLTRLLFRLDSVAEDLPALMATTSRDPRVCMVQLSERDAEGKDNLALWADDALGLRRLWSGRPLVSEKGQPIAPMSTPGAS